MILRVAAVVLALLSGGAGSARAQENDGIAALLARIEQAAKSADAPGFLALLTSGANRGRAIDFCATEFAPGVTRAVLKERDREPLRGTLPGNAYRLIVDLLTEFGSHARVSTWRLEIKKTGD